MNWHKLKFLVRAISKKSSVKKARPNEPGCGIDLSSPFSEPISQRLASRTPLQERPCDEFDCHDSPPPCGRFTTSNAVLVPPEATLGSHRAMRKGGGARSLGRAMSGARRAGRGPDHLGNRRWRCAMERPFSISSRKTLSHGIQLAARRSLLPSQHAACAAIMKTAP